MRAKPDSWSIVLAGFWNRMIFTPEWLSPRLFPGPEIETLVALLPVLPIIYRDPLVSLEVSLGRLAFRTRVYDDVVALERIEQMAHATLAALPETPIQAVGINFGFVEDTPPNEVIELFNLADDPQLGQAGWEIAERKLSRRLAHGSDIVNLTLTFTGAAVEVEFNFHADTPSNPIALAALPAGRLVTLKNTALGLLADVYNLNLD